VVPHADAVDRSGGVTVNPIRSGGLSLFSVHERSTHNRKMTKVLQSSFFITLVTFEQVTGASTIDS
jgi:hypothetical protein